MSTLQVNPSDDFEGDVGVKVDVTTTEFATDSGNPINNDGTVEHGVECTDENNSVTETFNFTAPVDNPEPPVPTHGAGGYVGMTESSADRSVGKEWVSKDHK